MKAAHSILIVIAILVAWTQTDGSATKDPQACIQAILSSLEKGEIRKVEVLQIPPRVLTRAQVTPEALERLYHNKLIIRDIAATAYRDRVVGRFKTILVQPRDEAADVRWGVIFYTQNDTRAGGVYFDRDGHNGYVDNISVSFQGNFFEWLDATYSTCFQ